MTELYCQLTDTSARFVTMAVAFHGTINSVPYHVADEFRGRTFLGLARITPQPPTWECGHVATVSVTNSTINCADTRTYIELADGKFLRFE